MSSNKDINKSTNEKDESKQIPKNPKESSKSVDGFVERTIPTPEIVCSDGNVISLPQLDAKVNASEVAAVPTPEIVCSDGNVISLPPDRKSVV